MEIAMVANFQAADIGWKQVAQPRRQRSALRQKRVDGAAVALLELRLAARELIQRRLGASQELLRPLSDILGRDRLGRELRNVVAACERQLHFRYPQSGLANAPQIGR